jgi:hypothetical protein
MDDRDRAELRALCDLFRRDMPRQVDEPPFDHDARQRIGQAIGKAGRAGRVGIRVFAAAEGVPPHVSDES